MTIDNQSKQHKELRSNKCDRYVRFVSLEICLMMYVRQDRSASYTLDKLQKFQEVSAESSIYQ